jgi:UDP-N-acetylmuramoyl-tripeptide--D-alanyl-D-alanine ligase
MDIRELHKLFLKSDGVSTDTRQLKSNQLFFALKGDNFDGNKYAQKALDIGAKAAIIDDKSYASEKTILVKDVLKTLQELGSYHRDYLRIPIIGITGSNGKTTTKRLIHDVLSQKFNVVSTKGNLNNHIGVPLSLLSLNENTEIGVIEMGANHQKEIEFLSNLAKPDFGYITNFGKAHLEGFGGVEGVIKGKSELYDFLRAHDKLAFVNADDKKQMEKLEHSKYFSIGEGEHAHFKVHFKSANPYVELEFENIHVKSKLIGEYNFRNIAAAIGIGHYFGVSNVKIKKAIQNFKAKDNRSQIKETSHNTLIMDAYNANPTSMKAALDSFKTYIAEHKTVILGDMYELGDDKIEEHRAIAEHTKTLGFDDVYFCGEIFKSSLASKNTFKVFGDFESLKEHLSKSSIKNSTILIKASRGMALERLVSIL